MGAREYVTRAQQLIDASEKAAPLHQVNAALRERDDEIASLKEQVALLAASTRKRSRTTADEGADA